MELGQGDERNHRPWATDLAKAQICAGSSSACRWKPTNERSGSLTAYMRPPRNQSITDAIPRPRRANSSPSANALLGKWHNREVVTRRRSKSSWEGVSGDGVIASWANTALVEKGSYPSLRNFPHGVSGGAKEGQRSVSMVRDSKKEPDCWGSMTTPWWRVVRPQELLNHLLCHQLQEGLHVRWESRGPCSQVWSWCPITRPSPSSHAGRAGAPAVRCGAGAL